MIAYFIGGPYSGQNIISDDQSEFICFENCRTDDLTKRETSVVIKQREIHEYKLLQKESRHRYAVYKYVGVTKI